MTEADTQYENALAEYETEKTEWDVQMQRRARSRAKNLPPEPEEPIPPRARMMKDEPENFLLFANALKIMVGSSIRIDKVDHARSLLERYLLGFSRTGGRLEVSMMREFHRAVGLDSVMDSLLSDPNSTPFERSFIQLLSRDGDGGEAMGTIQDAARDEQSTHRVQAGSIAQKAEKLSDHIRRGLWHYYNQERPQVHFPLESNPNPNTTSLSSHADTYNFALLDGRRIHCIP
ncbi:hypothetical protein C8J57DRAFT_1247758 [Mycena rebaudengoi]|nr:hypothetical protein C8J57DRAFT_1247758 [Mycena rebaudengoi]